MKSYIARWCPSLMLVMAAALLFAACGGPSPPPGPPPACDSRDLVVVSIYQGVVGARTDALDSYARIGSPFIPELYQLPGTPFVPVDYPTPMPTRGLQREGHVQIQGYDRTRVFVACPRDFATRLQRNSGRLVLNNGNADLTGSPSIPAEALTRFSPSSSTGAEASEWVFESLEVNADRSQLLQTVYTFANDWSASRWIANILWTDGISIHCLSDGRWDVEIPSGTPGIVGNRALRPHGQGYGLSGHRPVLRQVDGVWRCLDEPYPPR